MRENSLKPGEGKESSSRNWRDVFLDLGGVTVKRRIYPRDCYACGQPMVRVKDDVILKCYDCDIWETGTVNGRFAHQRDTCYEWDGDMIFFADHGAVDYPSPDCCGIARE